MSLFCIVYASTAVQPFSYQSLISLSAEAQRRNQAAEITGLLLYRDGMFMQTLEGGQAAVETLFEQIRKDARHSRVAVLLAEPIEQREYGRWSMALKSLSHPAGPQGEADAIGVLLAAQRTAGQSLARDLMRRFHEGAI